MNNVLIYQALAAAKAAAPAKTGGSRDSGEFSAIADIARTRALGDGETKKTTRSADMNPLAALLLAALMPQAVSPGSDEAESAAGSAVQGILPALQADPKAVPTQTDTAQEAPTGGFAANMASALAKELGLNAQETAMLQKLLQNLEAPAPAQPAAGQSQPVDLSQALAAAPTAEADPFTQIKQLFVHILAAESPDAQLSSPMASLLQGTDTATMAQLRQLMALAGSTAAIPQPSSASAGQPGADAAPTAPVTQASTQAQAAPVTPAATQQQGTGQERSAAGEDRDSQRNAGQPTDTATANPLLFGNNGKVNNTNEHPGKAAPLSQSVPEAFDKMVDTVSAMRRDGLKEMEIQLKPDFLGKVVIKLTMEDGSLVARITASNPRVQEAFQSQASTLQATLQDQGIKDVNVLVTHNAMGQSSLDQQTARQSQSGREQRRRNYSVAEQADKSVALKAVYAYEEAWRTGSINYLA